MWGIHRGPVNSRTNGQWRGKCFHLMTSSWVTMMTYCHHQHPLKHTRVNFISNIRTFSFRKKKSCAIIVCNMVVILFKSQCGNSSRANDAYASVNTAIIGSDNGLQSTLRQAIIYTNANLLSIGPLRTNFSEILIEIYIFLLKKNHFKMSCAKCWPSCLDLNALFTFHTQCLNPGKRVTMVTERV